MVIGAVYGAVHFILCGICNVAMRPPVWRGGLLAKVLLSLSTLAIACGKSLRRGSLLVTRNQIGGRFVLGLHSVNYASPQVISCPFLGR